MTTVTAPIRTLCTSGIVASTENADFCVDAKKLPEQVAEPEVALTSSEQQNQGQTSPRSERRITVTTSPPSRIAKLLVTFVATAILSSVGFVATPASAVKARWVLVGKEVFTIDGDTAKVPTYVNTNSIVGNQADNFTITFQARFNGKFGINRVNVGVVVDCYNEDANPDQFIIYYSPGSSDYVVYDDGEITSRMYKRALSFCR
jgi:hypothetical protein